MTMKGNNFHHSVKFGLALETQSIASAATVNGSAISEPWRDGRQLSFFLVGGDFGASTSLAITVQGLRRDDGTTWEALKQSDGSTDLTFTATDLDDAGPLEDGVLLGTVPTDEIDSVVYKSVRISVTENGGGANAVLLGACYVISDLYARPSGMSDGLLSKVLTQPAA